MFKRRPNTRRPGQGNRAKPVKASLAAQRVAKRAPAVKEAKPLPAAAKGLARRTVLAGAVFVLVSAALLTGWGLLSTSRALAVQRAEVEGTDHLSRLDILSAAEVGSDSNLLALPVGKIAARVRAIPWVERAEVSRRLPDTVVIQVVERRPMVMALVEGRIFYLDRELRPIAVHQRRALPDLPVITGLSRADLAQPDDEVLSLVDAVKHLLTVLPARDLASGGRLAEVHLDPVWGISLVFNDMAPVVRLGFKDFSRRLARLEQVRGDLARRGELGRARLIDLESWRRVVVRLGREKA
ncbi:MAG: FtsQ-type POTRA domain-containing protein [Desulfarculaceae bacterium]|nr:FtsQ-type POTRA domain-containing protein [Desulfarculaceae bacterium]